MRGLRALADGVGLDYACVAIHSHCMARKEAVYVRVDAEDKAILARVEATLGRETTLSAWIRSVLREAAQKRLAGLDSV